MRTKRKGGRVLRVRLLSLCRKKEFLFSSLSSSNFIQKVIAFSSVQFIYSFVHSLFFPTSVPETATLAHTSPPQPATDRLKPPACDTHFVFALSETTTPRLRLALTHTLQRTMATTQRKLGILVAIPIKGRKLVNKSGGKQSPYVQLRLGDQSKRTRASLIAAVEPEWDQEARISLFLALFNYCTCSRRL